MNISNPPSNLPDGSTAVTQPATDNSTKVATTAFAWSLPPIQQLADGTSVGGNARGANAVDWQSIRTAADHVASGSASVLAGGTSNSTPAMQAVVSGGLSNLSNGLQSWIPGGSAASARGLHGKGSWGSGQFATRGDAQAGEHLLRRQTADATSTRLTSDGAAAGSANTVNLPTNGTFLLRSLVVARQIGGTAGSAGDSKAWTVTQLIRRGANAAATVSIGATVTVEFADAGATNWGLAKGADTTNGGPASSVTGEANKTINWVERVMSVEVVG